MFTMSLEALEFLNLNLTILQHLVEHFRINELSQCSLVGAID